MVGDGEERCQEESPNVGDKESMKRGRSDCKRGYGEDRITTKVKDVTTRKDIGRVSQGSKTVEATRRGGRVKSVSEGLRVGSGIWNRNR